MTTGQRIQQARKKAKLSQKQLGEKLGLSASMIGQWENDLRNPKVETLHRIADALLVRVSDLADPTAYDLGFREGSEVEEFLNSQIDELWAQEGYTHSDQECKLVNAFSQLNDEGQEKVVSYAQDLIPRYRAKTGLESTPAPQEGKDTTPPSDAPGTLSEGK